MALAALALASCVKSDDVIVRGVEKMGFDGGARFEIVLSVENRSGTNIHLHSGRVTVMSGDQPIAEVMLSDKVRLPRRSTTSVSLPLQYRIIDPITAFMLMKKGKKIPEGLTLSGEAKVRAGMAKYTYRFDGEELSKFLFKFDPSGELLQNAPAI